jgi:ribosome-binding protein aMBF1 (putative translation factor)
MSKRTVTTQRVPPGAPVDDYFDRQMKNPEFAREYEALKPEFEIVNQIIALRLKRQMSQRDLAEKMGTYQPSIARFERRRMTTDLSFLRRVADALDADVTVSIVPRQARPADKPTPHA